MRSVGVRPLWVTRKILLELAREPKLAAVLFLLPLGLVVVTAASYSQPLEQTHPVLTMCADPECEAVAAELVEQRYSDGRPVFSIRSVVDVEVADEALRDGSALLLLRSAEGPNGVLAPSARGDGSNLAFSSASMVVQSAIDRRYDAEVGHSIIGLSVSPLTVQKPRTGFDIAAPGMFVFAILMLVPWTAMVLTREIRQRTLRRLRLTRLSALELLTGVTVAMMIVALMQVGLVFGASIGFGFQNQGPFWVALLAGLLLAFSGVGFGLVVASFTKNDGQASNIGGAVMMLQVFLSGSLFPMPPMTMFRVSGHEMGPFDLLPATHSFQALRQVMGNGCGIEDVALRLVASLVLSLLCFAAGVALFHRLHMRAQA